MLHLVTTLVTLGSQGALSTICQAAHERKVTNHERVTHLHELFIIYLNPSVVISVNALAAGYEQLGLASQTQTYKASVKVFTTTQARTNRSKVIPGGGPYPEVGPEAMRDVGFDKRHRLAGGTYRISVLPTLGWWEIACTRRIQELETVHVRRWIQSGLGRNA